MLSPVLAGVQRSALCCDCENGRSMSEAMLEEQVNHTEAIQLTYGSRPWLRMRKFKTLKTSSYQSALEFNNSTLSGIMR